MHAGDRGDGGRRPGRHSARVKSCARWCRGRSLSRHDSHGRRGHRTDRRRRLGRRRRCVRCVRAGVGQVLPGGRGDDRPRRVVPDEGRGGQPGGPEDDEPEDDEEAGAAAVGHPFWVSRMRVHCCVIGRPAPPLEAVPPVRRIPRTDTPPARRLVRPRGPLAGRGRADHGGRDVGNEALRANDEASAAKTRSELHRSANGEQHRQQRHAQPEVSDNRPCPPRHGLTVTGLPRILNSPEWSFAV